MSKGSIYNIPEADYDKVRPLVARENIYIGKNPMTKLEKSRAGSMQAKVELVLRKFNNSS